MPKNAGLAPLLLLILIGVVLLIVYVLARGGGIQLPGGRPTSKIEPNVELQTEYKNPFSKESQYVNPFSQYKNPFDNL